MAIKSTNTEITKCQVTWKDIKTEIKIFTEKFKMEDRQINVYGIPKNGMLLTAFLPSEYFLPMSDINDAEIILDDIVDSGRTRDKYLERYISTSGLLPSVL